MLRTLWKRRTVRAQYKNYNTSALIGDVKIQLISHQSDSRLIPNPQFDNTPNELVQHLRWMGQKYSLNQDMYLCGHPGPLKRRLAMSFANICGMEVEYVQISRDTTESDIKQRKEIIGDSVVFYDQAPVRAAIHGRLLILDGIEYAERNVLPSLNNLLENREMALEDGRFLTKNVDGASPSSCNLVKVHPNFRVIALGQCVPPYNGRTMDPPFRSRFQSRFIDEVSSETILELNSQLTPGLERKKMQQLIDFYESLRVIRSTLVLEGGAGVMAGLPVFSIDSMAHAITMLSTFKHLDVSDVVQRSVPACTWMLPSVPSRLRPAIVSAFDRLRGTGSMSTTPSTYKITRFDQVRASVEFTREGEDQIKDVVALPVPVGCRRTDDVNLSSNCSDGIDLGASKRGESYEGLSACIADMTIPCHEGAMTELLMDHACGRHLCLLGPKGSGKSHLASSLGRLLGYKVLTFPLYQELTSRDLLQRRVTVTGNSNPNSPIRDDDTRSSSRTSSSSSSSSNSSSGLTGAQAPTPTQTQTSWVDSPLIAAARGGHLCVLDGIDRIDAQTMFTLRTLLQDGMVDLPNGDRLTTQPTRIAAPDGSPAGGMSDNDIVRAGQYIHPAFRVIALGLSPSVQRPEDARERWISSDLGFAYHRLNAASSQEIAAVLKRKEEKKRAANVEGGNSSQFLAGKEARKTSVGGNFSSAFDSVLNVFSSSARTQPQSHSLPQLLEQILEALDKASDSTGDLQLSLRQASRLQRTLRGPADGPDRDISAAHTDAVKSLEGMLMVKFMPRAVAERFYAAMESIGVKSNSSKNDILSPITIESDDDTLRIGSIQAQKRTPVQLEKVPQPLFHANAAQTLILQDLLQAYSTGEKAMLLIGNQGVGKNKLADRLLQLLGAEREYIQLHRDTTIQSLTLLPLLDGGKIIYEDSPMIRAARDGRVLVVDEADKAPLEVVCLLKSLAEDGELILYDGRRLLSHQRFLAEGGDLSQPLPPDIILIHPDFLLIVLANRPGFPFLGNNFFRECGDVFSTYVIDNLDLNSEVQLLRAYGPEVDESILCKIAGAFSDLREAHVSGDLAYPFSAREAVSVVKHFAAYPHDGVAAAVEDILGFDTLTPLLRAQVAKIFQSHGLPVPLQAAGGAIARPPVALVTPLPLPAATTVAVAYGSTDPSQSQSVQQMAAMAQPGSPSKPGLSDLSRPVSTAASSSPSVVSGDAAKLSRVHQTLRRPCPRSIRPMKVSDWTVNTVSKSPYSIASTRLLRFDEELGRLFLAGADLDTEKFRGCVVDMVADNPRQYSTHTAGEGALESRGSSLHVLTSEPLSLHSFTNVSTSADRLRGRIRTDTTAQMQHIRRDLISDEMGWRLGSLQPLLVPLQGPEGGCAVLLPDLSMALVVDADSQSPVKMLTLPLKTKEKTGKSGGSLLGVNFFGGSSSSSSRQGGGARGKKTVGRYMTVSSTDPSAPHLTAIYREGSLEIAFVDFASATTQVVDIETPIHEILAQTSKGNKADGFDESMRGISGLLFLGGNQWLVSTSISNESSSSAAATAGAATYSLSVPPLSNGTVEATLTPLALTSVRPDSTSLHAELGLAAQSKASATWLAGERHQKQQQQDDQAQEQEQVSKIATISGSSRVYGSVYRAGNDGEAGPTAMVDTWLRSTGSARMSTRGETGCGWPVVQATASSGCHAINVAFFEDQQQQKKQQQQQHGAERRQEATLRLELVDVVRKTIKGVDLSRPSSNLDAKSAVKALALVQCSGSLSHQQQQQQQQQLWENDGSKLTAENSTRSVLAAPSAGSARSGAGSEVSDLAAVCYADGVIRLFEIGEDSLQASQTVWEKLFGMSEAEKRSWTVVPKPGSGSGARGEDGKGNPRTGLGSPKHGKEDPKNEPHVGGNTWAGGTGGSDTAGLGGRGGPYRLDKGHKVHQVTDAMKAQLSQTGREQAAALAKEALAKRLEEISMGASDYAVYLRYKQNVEVQISQLRSILEELARRSRERVWLRHQAQGDLDDSKLVDGLAGDRLVFKRRGVPDSPHGHTDSSGDGSTKKRLQFVVDVSGSMFRFNGEDRRLERMLEAVLLVMEAMPQAVATGGGNIDYCISGHSGSSNNIRFLDFDATKPSNENERLGVLENMVAHSQYTLSGDNTLGAVEAAIENCLDGTEGQENTDRYVFVFSDANFDRYGISPKYLSALMTKDKRVQVHFILIASLADEAERIAKALPMGRAHICFASTDLPSVLRSILTSAGGVLDI